MFEEVNVNDLASAPDISLFYSATSIPVQSDRENDTKKVLPLGYMAEKDWKGTKSEKSYFEKRLIKAKETIGLIFLP